MLADNDAIATIAVKDVEVARNFYGNTLGLKEQPDSDDRDVITYVSGNSRVLVYASQYAGTNEATAATWVVGDDLESIVRTLKQKGVTFEHYDLPELTRQGDIHSARGVKVAWLKDPDGNILSLLSVNQ